MKRTMIAITARQIRAGARKIEKTIAFITSYHMTQPAIDSKGKKETPPNFV